MSDKFVVSDLGHRERGEVVEVTLSGNAANVRLLDSSNYQSYKNGRQHTYRGGLAKQSPVRLPIPHSGRWYVTVDMQGLRGQTRSSVRVLPRPLPEIRERPLSSMPSLIRQDATAGPGGQDADRHQFDVFVSYASEDRDIVNELVDALKAGGLSVWFDGSELKIGDNLRRKIDAGLANSTFGVVVLSHAFFDKEWPQYELDGLVTRDVERDDEQVILPIWHKITKAEVIQRSPSLATRIARSTATHTPEEIANEIVGVVAGAQHPVA
ncbi:MAG: DUF1883 domain-containing protein [Chloroflexota bacterium]|nr:DUF1883 domain-containing protein [Chloroflexota bacterium]